MWRKWNLFLIKQRVCLPDALFFDLLLIDCGDYMDIFCINTVRILICNLIYVLQPCTCYRCIMFELKIHLRLMSFTVTQTSHILQCSANRVFLFDLMFRKVIRYLFNPNIYNSAPFMQ